MAANKKILSLPGDGIGPEVMRQVNRVVEWFDKKRIATFDVTEDLVGGAAFDKYGTPLAEETMERAMESDAVLFGAVGGPKWDNLPFAQKPERGLLRLRKDMDLFANLRPALVFDPLIGASTLKPEVIEGLDILIIRELTGGTYFGEPRGITTLPDGTRRGVNTQVYTTPEIIRVGRVAFELARKRHNRVCSVEKANVMESGVLWREEMQKLHDTEYKDVELSHMYADNCAMQLVRNPKQFDVIVTDNLFGDLLVRLCGDADRLARHAALGLARRAGFERPPQGALRAGPRLGAGHRRQGRGQSARLHALFRDDAALFLRHEGRGRAGRESREQRACLRRSYWRHHAARDEARLDHRDGQRRPRRAREAGVAPFSVIAISAKRDEAIQSRVSCSGLLRPHPELVEGRSQ